MTLQMMQKRALKAGFWTLMWMAIAASGSLLTACSKASQPSVQASSSPAATDTGSMKGMDHSGMDKGSMSGMSMDLGPADADFDLRFIDAMTPHHQGAVMMAKEAEQKSKRPEIKNLAADIIKAQNQEIAQLKQWRTAWYPKAESTPMAYDSKMGKMMPMSSDQMNGMMMNMDLGAADDQFDLRFINAMIPHHESAVTMATDALSKTKRPEIKKLAEDIVSSQQAEIAQMKQWRKAWYNQ
ncbi:DUF305 domain-containing protein [Phormidesmis priestleyi]